MPRCQAGSLIALLLLPMAGCSGGGGETPLSRARPGETVVRNGNTRVVLEHAFRPGQPNGLYGGIIRVQRAGAAEQRWEVNGVCSMPGLQQEGWPAYDNLYGHRLAASGGAKRGQRWQVLYHFDGRVQGRLDSGSAAEQAWLSDLRDNICRRGRFDDRKR